MSMELDHLIPEALGGLTEEVNLWLACSLCNDSKGCRIAAEDPSTGEVVRLFNPRHQDWHEHFSWSEGGSTITGRTPTGRAAVVALRLNRPTLTLHLLIGSTLDSNRRLLGKSGAAHARARARRIH